MRLDIITFLLAISILAGCVSESGPGAAPPMPSDPAVMAGPDCPLTFPDNTTMPCNVQGLVEPERTDRPPMTEGWKCVNEWGEDGVHTELWIHPDGDVGFYWEWERFKQDGLALQRLAFYESMEEGIVVHTQYARQGFVSIGPQDPPGEVDIHNTLRQFRAFALVGDEWIHPENVTFLVTGWGAETWAAARFDWPGGPYYVSLMEPDPDDEQHTQWDVEGFEGLVGGTEVIIDVLGTGIKYNGQDYDTLRFQRGYSCAVLPDL